MKAVQIHQYGDPGVLRMEEVSPPEVAPGEVLVRVQAAGINPVDVKTRSGAALAGRYGAERFPLILGWDISGTVAEIGPGVSGFQVGDQVFGMPRFPDVAGAYAEYVTAPVADLAHKPERIDHLQAAALPLVSLTAWQVLFEAAGLGAGQRILVHAAAGGVGHIAVQLARWKGAYVIGTASQRNRDFLTEIGLDQFVDYQVGPFEALVSDVDVVLDSLSGDVRARSWGVLKPAGILVSILGPPSEHTAAGYGVRAASVLVRPQGNQLARIAALVDEGVLEPHLDGVYPLSKAARAHEHVARGHTRGKVVLQID